MRYVVVTACVDAATSATSLRCHPKPDTAPTFDSGKLEVPSHPLRHATTCNRQISS